METVARDPQLWRMAKARAKFKSHAVTYLLGNALLWGIWFVSGSHSYGRNFLPWPVWPTLFWGIGLAIQGLTTYGFTGRNNWSEREYERLLRDKQAGRL
ncbi:2TM domain-containing protein [Hymenobacter koreensis]|uniref:2TM domain-containing protein n=1 Tax=Hymenobacter koreensis TaxID=1084523 RepID=A0ABP8ITK1_9BACT